MDHLYWKATGWDQPSYSLKNCKISGLGSSSPSVYRNKSSSRTSINCIRPLNLKTYITYGTIQRVLYLITLTWPCDYLCLTIKPSDIPVTFILPLSTNMATKFWILRQDRLSFPSTDVRTYTGTTKARPSKHLSINYWTADQSKFQSCDVIG